MNPPRKACGTFGVLLFWFGSVASAMAQSTNHPVFAARAEDAFRQAQMEFRSGTNDSAAWQFGRACFDLADFATNKSERAAIARQGIAACEKLLARVTNSAPGHYYLAMNFGRLAEAEAPSLAAYHLIRQIEHEFKAAAELDPAFDYAGPARGLGLLYRDAPGWPVSIGSRRKAHEWLVWAVQLAPDYPENQLNLAESYVKWHETDRAENSLMTLEALWPNAETRFTGEVWAPGWQVWSSRREALRRKLGGPSAPVAPPRRAADDN